jgi:REP element-mobilizing transposase RayT
MMRGNNREKIFELNRMKMFFTDLLKKILPEEYLELVAYCIMENHVHLIIEGEDIEGLSKAMKRINISYAMRYNKEFDRIGHVFQDRYRSENITSEAYLLNVIRYVHNNPIKAGMVKNLRDYSWSSYQEYISNKTKLINIEQKNFIMDFFKSCNEFISFHNQLDNNEYLDIKEDVERNRIITTEKIINNYCIDKGINSRKELINNQKALIDLIKKLLDTTTISHRKIADILGISSSLVHKINLDLKK